MSSNLLRELEALGYITEQPQSKGELNRILEKVASTLLQKSRDGQNIQTALLERNRSLQTQIDALRLKESSHDEAKSKLEREIERLENKQSVLLAERAAEAKQLTCTKEDLVKTRQALQSVRANAARETLRKDNELSAALSKLAVSGQNGGQKDVLKNALANLEEVRKSIILENENLRAGHYTVLIILQDAIHMGGATPQRWNEVTEDIYSHPEPHVTLPATTVSMYVSALAEQLSQRVAVISTARETAEKEASTAERQLNQEKAQMSAKFTILNNKQAETLKRQELLEDKHRQALLRVEDRKQQLERELDGAKDRIVSLTRKADVAVQSNEKLHAKLDKTRAKSDKRAALYQIADLGQTVESLQKAALDRFEEQPVASKKRIKHSSTTVLQPKSNLTPEIDILPAKDAKGKGKDVVALPLAKEDEPRPRKKSSERVTFAMEDDLRTSRQKFDAAVARARV